MNTSVSPFLAFAAGLFSFVSPCVMAHTRTITLLLTVLLTLAAGCTAVTRSPGKIELSASEFDFGTTGSTGPVSQTFQVRNVGLGMLEITGVSTSCGCTTAQVSSRSLGPGQSADLTVTYDPQAHGGAVGKYLRIVYVRSDAPETPEASLTIRVTVVES